MVRKTRISGVSVSEAKASPKGSSAQVRLAGFRDECCIRPRAQFRAVLGGTSRALFCLPQGSVHAGPAADLNRQRA